jgi:hypothetical protein
LMASSEISDNYTGRVLQRSPFRNFLSRRRTTGGAITSVLGGVRRLPGQPARTPAPPTGARRTGRQS